MGKKVLLADDSATTRKMVEIALRETPFELQEASNGKQAIDQLASFHPDIVFADAIMPEMDGYEVCKYIKTSPKFQNIPVVLLTTRFQLFDEDRAKEVGIDMRVNKPLSEHQLISIINDLIPSEETGNAGDSAATAKKPAAEDLEETAPLGAAEQEADGGDATPSEGDLNESTVQMSAADLDALLREDRGKADQSGSEQEEEIAQPSFGDLDENNQTVQMDASQIQELIDSDHNDFENTVKMTPEELMAHIEGGGSEQEAAETDDELPAVASFDLEEEAAESKDETPSMELDFSPPSVPDTLELGPEDLEDLPTDQEGNQLPEGAFDTLPGSFSRGKLLSEDGEAREAVEDAPMDPEAEIDTEILSDELPEIDLDDTGTEESFELPPETEAPQGLDDTDELPRVAEMETEGSEEVEESDLNEEEIRFAQTRPAPTGDILEDSGGQLSLEETPESNEDDFFELPEPRDAEVAPEQDLLEADSLEELDDEDLEPLEDSIGETGPEETQEEEVMTNESDWEEEQLSPTTPIEESAEAEALSEDDFRLELEEELDPDLIEDTGDGEQVELVSFDEGDNLLETSSSAEGKGPAGEDTEPVEEPLADTEPVGVNAVEEDTEPLEDEPLLLEEENAAAPEEPDDTAPIPMVQFQGEGEIQTEDDNAGLPPVSTDAAEEEPDTEPLEHAVAGLNEEQLNHLADRVVEKVMERISSNTIQDIVWQVVPELTEAMIKKRIFQLEQSVDQD